MYWNYRTNIKVLLIVAFFLNSCTDSSQYKTSIQQFREMKNENFINPAASPLAKDELKNFQGLSYFTIKQDFCIEAKFVPAKMSQYVSLFESDEVNQVHVVRGKLLFELNSKQCTLTAYSSAGQAHHSLFVPFVDSDKNSYPGGRYVDGKLLNDSTCLLDFNLSYNPYCVYNETYKCAVVPMGNRLSIAIPAGEKWEN